MENNLRTYGSAPFTIAVIHGGPGAAGEMAPVAHELARSCGVLEPLQTEPTLNGQLQELKDLVEDYGSIPIILIGFSWGALLGFIFTAQNPTLVKKLILVSSGVFEERFAAAIMSTRFHRLSKEERSALNALIKNLNNPAFTDKNALFAQFGEYLKKADSFDPLPQKDETIDYQYEIFERVWKETEELRTSGQLLTLGIAIPCPVIAIHGNYDPHPADGIRVPLSRSLKNFHFILLENCGHRPWAEKWAKDRFYEILMEEIRCNPK
jgi:pimeloyl-ACP methyl ester carboxylesterase